VVSETGKICRIGLYGGTFDPPHHGHLILAEWVRNQLHLDSVYFIPAAVHPLKENTHITPQKIRLEMIRAAVAGYDYFHVSDIEINRAGTSYTVDTLKSFPQYEHVGSCELYFIIGYDNYREINLWRDAHLLGELACFVVLRRTTHSPTKESDKQIQNTIELDSPKIDISSTGIRENCRNGIPFKAMVPGQVFELIQRHGLYRGL
jgi:nicotinate-nucleotide adenylyltransferase